MRTFGINTPSQDPRKGLILRQVTKSLFFVWGWEKGSYEGPSQKENVWIWTFFVCKVFRMRILRKKVADCTWPIFFYEWSSFRIWDSSSFRTRILRKRKAAVLGPFPSTNGLRPKFEILLVSGQGFFVKGRRLYLAGLLLRMVFA